MTTKRVTVPPRGANKPLLRGQLENDNMDGKNVTARVYEAYRAGVNKMLISLQLLSITTLIRLGTYSPPPSVPGGCGIRKVVSFTPQKGTNVTMDLNGTRYETVVDGGYLEGGPPYCLGKPKPHTCVMIDGIQTDVLYSNDKLAAWLHRVAVSLAPGGIFCGFLPDYEHLCAEMKYYKHPKTLVYPGFTITPIQPVPEVSSDAPYGVTATIHMDGGDPVDYNFVAWNPFKKMCTRYGLRLLASHQACSFNAYYADTGGKEPVRDPESVPFGVSARLRYVTVFYFVLQDAPGMMFSVKSAADAKSKFHPVPYRRDAIPESFARSSRSAAG